MENNTAAQANMIQNAEEYRTLEHYLAEMLQLRCEIDAEQEEIERLKADSQELKAETRAMLTTLKATILK